MGKKSKPYKIELDGVNEIYKYILNTDARIVICYGGRDSGKSYFVGGQYIPKMLCMDDYFRGVAVRKVSATHRDSCYQEVLDGLDVLAEKCDAERERLIKNAQRRAKRRIKALREEWEKQRADSDKKHSGENVGGFPEKDTKAEKQKEIVEQAILSEELKKADVEMPTDGVKYRYTPMEIKHDNGGKLIFRGLDKPRKLKSLKGINFVWVEEAEDLSREEFYELMLLLRGGKKQQIVLTFNPVDEGHFSNAMFVESVADEVLQTFSNGDKKVWIKNLHVTVDGEDKSIKALVLRTTYEDNGYISVERKSVIEQLANTDPYLYDVYRLGKFGTRGGRILMNVKEVDFEKDNIKFIDFDNRGYAQDFGFNHANCILAVGEKDNNLYVFDELYGHNKDTAEWIAEADKKRYERRLLMVCDSAEPDRIKTWVKAGYRAVGVKKYQGSVIGQIDRLKRYNNIYINSCCENTLREAREWKWKQNKSGRFVDIPNDANDDAMAALRYSCDLFAERQAEMLNVQRGMRKMRNR